MRVTLSNGDVCVCVSVCVWKKYVVVVLLGLSSSGPCKFMSFIAH